MADGRECTSMTADMDMPALAAHLADLRDYVADGGSAALAVSGGADSMALLHLVARSVAVSNRILVLTVDHGLRQTSTSEAQTVADRAISLGYRHQILTWTGSKPQTGIEAHARAARYQLLTDAARANGIAAIVTAHTADDQAETLLMRLARGSGLDGLSAMAPVSSVHGILLLRPLLQVSHAELVGFLREHGLAWLDDPSNRDSAYERVRLRQQRETLTSLGLTQNAIGRSARRLMRARQALTAETERHALLIGSVDTTGAVALERDGWDALPEELRLRLLARAIAVVTGDGDPVNLAALEDLATDIRAGSGGRSLHGALIIASRARLLIVREIGRQLQAETVLEPGSLCIWDRRFAVALAPDAGEPVLVRVPTHAELDAVRKASAPSELPWRARAATPVCARADGTLLAAPLLGLLHPAVSCRLLVNWTEPLEPALGPAADRIGNG
jgi:tRNA(Ile)-lysidine synthase